MELGATRLTMKTCLQQQANNPECDVDWIQFPADDQRACKACTSLESCMCFRRMEMLPKTSINNTAANNTFSTTVSNHTTTTPTASSPSNNYRDFNAWSTAVKRTLGTRALLMAEHPLHGHLSRPVQRRKPGCSVQCQGQVGKGSAQRQCRNKTLNDPGYCHHHLTQVPKATVLDFVLQI